MERYEFGVMSNKWELYSNDIYTAKITMAIFINKNIPIAIYSPKQEGFMPQKILENSIIMDNFEPNKVKKCFKTVKELSNK